MLAKDAELRAKDAQLQASVASAASAVLRARATLGRRSTEGTQPLLEADLAACLHRNEARPSWRNVPQLHRLTCRSAQENMADLRRRLEVLNHTPAATALSGEGGCASPCPPDALFRPSSPQQRNSTDARIAAAAARAAAAEATVAALTAERDSLRCALLDAELELAAADAQRACGQGGDARAADAMAAELPAGDAVRRLLLVAEAPAEASAS